MDVEMDKSGIGRGRRGVLHQRERDRWLEGAQAALKGRLAPQWGALGWDVPTRKAPFQAAVRLFPRVSGMSPNTSELGNQLGPDRDHPDEQRNRRQCGCLFHENLQHACLLTCP